MLAAGINVYATVLTLSPLSRADWGEGRLILRGLQRGLAVLEAAV
jgi:hypothetical protein